MCAKVSNVGTRIVLDQYDLSGFLNAADLGVKQELPVVTCFSDTGPRRLVGNYDHSHGHSGLFDASENSYDQIVDALRTATDADHYLLQLFGAYAAGSVAYESIVRAADMPRKAQQGQAITLDLAMEGAGHLSRGLVLLNGTITGDGNQTAQNVGASTAGQITQVVFRVISGTFTRIDLSIEESQQVDGNPDAFAAIAGLTHSFTAANTAAVARYTTAAATEAYKRVVVSNWAGTSAVVLVTLGLVAGT